MKKISIREKERIREERREKREEKRRERGENVLVCIEAQGNTTGTKRAEIVQMKQNKKR